MPDPLSERPRRVWLMGLANVTYGYLYAVPLVTVPQQLAARGVPEPEIANITALVLAVSLATFALAPVLDTSMSRRRWSVALGLLATILALAVLLLPTSSALLAPGLAVMALATSLYNAAIGGWLGAALPKSCDETVGTWFGIGNALGFSLGAMCQFWLLTHLPMPLGALAVVGVGVMTLPILLALPRPSADRKAMRETFGTLARDVTHLARRGPVLRIAGLLAMPCAAFTLTNAFGGLGGDFHASASVVGAANGMGQMVASLLGALTIRLVMARVPAPLLYLLVGSVGAGFTLLLLPLPHTAPVYVLAVLGECVAQTCAQVVQNAIIFRSIAPDDPLASSQFGLLQSALIVPYAYMQALDGYGYRLAGGVAGSLLMDAGVSLAACALMVVPVLRWLRNGRLEPDQATPQPLGCEPRPA
ncbi:MFS transporter [Novosphingobium rosa]|uniref:MFS transporter n=1 Tax=Novosphingobium rosa TaxID=76978 RepID=UPI000AEFCDD4|nr:MFS transporter [Novosphingobium rosa]